MKLSNLEEQTEEPILFQKPVVREELLGIVCRRPYSLFSVGLPHLRTLPLIS